ncbi:MAG: 6,7-dimethyl-8-ribityllumazine synthase [Tannerellaceae bacterium]|nr:6,7-dimethyl-8-ribityllumazine synthase [Tannerellaceae bacterium]
MATVYQNLSDYDSDTIPNIADKNICIGIVVSEWNENITQGLLDSASKTLQKHGVKAENIFIKHVPGSFELTYGARRLPEQVQKNYNKKLHAVIALGCVVRGDTPHFDYVCSGVTQGITQLNMQGEIPFIFGLLTTDTMQQAEERAGGKYGNKGDEAAITAIKMALFAWK